MATTTKATATAKKPVARKPAVSKTTTARKPVARKPATSKTTTARKPTTPRATTTRPVRKSANNGPFGLLNNLPKVDLNKVDLPTPKQIREEITGRLDGVQEAVLAAPARAQEVVIDLRVRYQARADVLIERYQVRATDLRKQAEDAVTLVREIVGRG